MSGGSKKSSARQEEISLAYAFNLLVVEDLQELFPIHSGWTIRDLGHAKDSATAAFAVDARRPPTRDDFFYELDLDCCPYTKIRCPDFHGFRVDVGYVQTMHKAKEPWQRTYEGKPYIYARLHYCETIDHLLWPAGESAPTHIETSIMNRNTLKFSPTPANGVRLVCNRMLALIEDPKCQNILAGKISTAMANWFLAGIQLLDH